MATNKNYARLFDVDKDEIYDRKWEQIAKLFEDPYLSMEHYAKSYAHPGAAAFNGIARVLAHFATAHRADEERKSNKEKLAAARAKEKEDYINLMNEQGDKTQQRALELEDRKLEGNRDLLDRKLKGNREAELSAAAFKMHAANQKAQEQWDNDFWKRIRDPNQQEYVRQHPEAKRHLVPVNKKRGMFGMFGGDPTNLLEMDSVGKELVKTNNPFISRNDMINQLAAYFKEDVKEFENLPQEILINLYKKKIIK
jgi:hypothetical protein